MMGQTVQNVSDVMLAKYNKFSARIRSYTVPTYAVVARNSLAIRRIISVSKGVWR